MAFEIQGTKALNAAFARLVEHAVPQAAVRALYQLGEEILTQSQEIVPVDTGSLKRSGHTTLPAIEGDQIVVTIGYGGPSAPYALPVHERIDVFHRPPTQAKFLESPVLAAAKRLETALTQAVQNSVREGGRA